MIKSNKKNVIISALLSIVMCISLIVGVTLAIATSDSKVNIAITGAKIDVVATVDETSVQKKQLNTEYAADGSTYSGEVEFDGGTVSLKNFVAGDGVKFNIIVKNNSTVTVNYRTVLAIENNSGLFQALKVLVDGKEFTSDYYCADWQAIEEGSDDVTITVAIELPADATNFSGKTCDLTFAVEAIQGNAELPDDNHAISANETRTVNESETTYFAKVTGNGREARLIAPAGSLSSGEYTFKVASKLDGMVKAADGKVCYSYDIKLLDSEGNVVSANEGTEFTIELLLFEAIQNVEVYHNGTLIAEPTVTSDNHISFNTASFSTFDVVFDAPVAKVNGENYYSLSSAVYASGLDGYITILRDFTTDGATMNRSNKKLTLDLNGHTITFNENERFKLFMGELTVTGKGTMQEAVPNYAPIVVTHKTSYPAVVNIGKDVTLKGWAGLFVNPRNSYDSYGNYSLEANIDGTLIGVNDANNYVGAGLYINGANVTVDPAITVNISETAVLTGTGHGIYGAGYAVYNTCGTITGGHTGVEIRAGQLNVTGGTITGNGVPTEVEGNGSGATTIGAGIAVAQHTTKLPTELNVTGGVINGYTALNQSNPQNNDDESVAKVKLSVSGGTFNVINGGTNAVYSENFTGFITGGTFINFDPSTMPFGENPSYVKVGYSVVSESENGNVWYTVIEGVSTASANVTVDETNKTTEEVKIVSEGKIAENAAATVTVPVGTKVTAGATELTLSIADAEVPEGITVAITQNAPKALNIHMAGLAADNDKLIKVEFHIEKGLSVVEINHDGKAMSRCGAMKWLDADQEFYYDAETGLVTMLTKNFSTFTYTSDKFYWDDKVKDAKHTYGTPVDTINKIITIASAKDLALFKYEVTDNKVNYNGYTLNITADIDLGSGFWRPINPVNDLTVNGNGHTISNLLVRSSTYSDKNGAYGFGFIANARGNLTIKNLSFDGANVAKSKGAETRYSGNVGGIVVAYAYGTTLFENVTVTNSSVYGYGKIGCILGMGAAPGISVTFKNCVSKDNSIYGATNLGGLAGNIQRKNGVDNGKVENCTVENITVNYDPNTYYGYYVDLENVNATYKSNDTADGEDVIRSVTGKWYVRDGYYWGTYGDYYVSYGNSSYDAPVDGHTEKIANSEYCVNKAN